MFGSNRNMNEISINYQNILHFINLKISPNSFYKGNLKINPNNFTKAKFKFLLLKYVKNHYMYLIIKKNIQ